MQTIRKYGPFYPGQTATETVPLGLQVLHVCHVPGYDKEQLYFWAWVNDEHQFLEKSFRLFLDDDVLPDNVVKHIGSSCNQYGRVSHLFEVTK